MYNRKCSRRIGVESLRISRSVVGDLRLIIGSELQLPALGSWHVGSRFSAISHDWYHQVHNEFVIQDGLVGCVMCQTHITDLVSLYLLVVSTESYNGN